MLSAAGGLDGAESSKSSVKTPQQRARKALAKFIASFKEGTGPPPTRSWRNLQTLESFNAFFDKFSTAAREQDLAVVRSEMKVFKAALNDLVSLFRGAIQTLSKAQDAVLKKKEKDKARPAQQGQRQASVEASLFEFVAEKGAQMEHKSLKSLTAPLGDDTSFVLDLILPTTSLAIILNLNFHGYVVKNHTIITQW